LSKVYNSEKELQEKILNGINKLADNVASTLGPRGRNVLLHKKGTNPIITKDGVTVADFVDLDDPTENAAAQLLKQVSAQTNAVAGDGTTTATVLARSMLVKAQAHLVAGASPVELKRGMDTVVDALVEKLKEQALPIKSVKDIEQVAKISANGDEAIGKLIATAVDQAGKDGAITIEEARTIETSLEMEEGFRFDSGYISSQFVTDQRRGAAHYNDALLLVTDDKIASVDEMMPVLEIVAREARPLIVVAEEVEGQALAALIMNAVRGTLKVVAVKAPRYGSERRELLKDLALSTGATFVSREAGVRLRDVSLEHLGEIKTADITKYNTTIVGGASDPTEVDSHIEALKRQLEETEDIHDCEKIQERITRLASGIAIIRVGAATQVEMTEKKHRLEDALEAVRAARLDGVVAGGGVALIRAARGLQVSLANQEQALGAQIVITALVAPLRQMAENAGRSPDLTEQIVNTTLKAEDEVVRGVNFMTGQLVDMLAEGIIDPVRVTIAALQNAVSVSSSLITTNYAIVEADTE
jgi:chaperonin GroEL